MHCVDLYIVKKINGWDDLFDKVPCADTGEYLLIPLTEDLCTYFKINPVSALSRVNVENSLASKFGCVVQASTDYFGGFGEQSASIWKNGKKLVYGGDGDHSHEWPNINSALREMGVVKKVDIDEFDTVGLGRYRENDKVVEEWKTKKFGPVLCDYCGSRTDSCTDVESEICEGNPENKATIPTSHIPDNKVQTMVMHTECPTCHSDDIFFDKGWQCRGCGNKWKS